MRRIVIAIGSTLTGLVLLFSWPTSLNRAVATAAPAPAGSSTASSAPAAAAPAPAADASAGTGAAPSADPAPAAAAAGTYVGSSVSTQFGSVQVQVIVTDGAVSAAEAIDYPNSNSKDQRINSYAIPLLNSEAVQAKSASIQMVSGATYTSGAYINSLQSALDQAGL